MGNFRSLQHQEHGPSIASPSSFARPVRPFAPVPLHPSVSAPHDVQANLEHARRSGHSLDRISIFPPEQNTASPAHVAKQVVQRRTEDGIQRQNVPPIKKNNTGLPDTLKAGVEDISGLSLDDVQVHYNSSKPAEVQALAITQRAEIHIGPGQEQHLAHEAWHVVQQKQGRVKPTLQAKGVKINDDQGLEREADVMETRIAQMKGKVRPSNVNPSFEQENENLGQRQAFSEPWGNDQTSFIPGTSSAVIQRKVGFEFESVGDKKWRFQGRDDDNENWAGIRHTKELLLLTPNQKAGLSGDNGNVEVVTKPLSTWEEISQTFKELEELIKTLYQQREKVLSGGENTYAGKVTGFAQHKIVANGVFKAKPQATIGIAAMNIEALFKKLQAMHNKPASQEEQVIANKILVYQMDHSAKEARFFIVSAMNAAGKKMDHLPELIVDEMVGMLSIILKTLWDAYSNDKDLKDPKYAFPLMPRTDFRSMLESLEPEASDTLIELWDKRFLEKVIDAKYSLSDYVFPRGYTNESKKKSKGPTKREWLASIFAGNGPKDLLSPPEGYPAHANTARPEGLGAYPADDHLILFELRDLMEAGPLEVNAWIKLATAVAQLVGTVENDRKLIPH